ncbi:MAG: rRNA cytosine-C5-methylase [Alistipes sp.]|nr:rRNA cytosine-C5-methylase [Alistipes sp.]
MSLPERFAVRTAEELGAQEGAALCAALEGVPPVSVRLHPLRAGRWRDAEPIPWSPLGRYLAERPSFTCDPDFHAGAYYVQEPSSQFVAHALAGEPLAGKRVLDLCAAPGGKTTLYASLVGADGLVVANEISRQRAAVLADNVRKWGLGNTAVTVGDAAQAGLMTGWFDAVAVDAPCSGEGMFRKMPEAREEWSEGNVRLCAARQLEILREAWKALRPGGILLYSTCTFNRSENEGTLDAFAAEAGGEIVPSREIVCPEAWGVVCGRRGAFQTFRFFPHRARGEGFFLAVARKADDASCGGRPPKPRRNPFAPVGRRESEELRRWVLEPERMRFAAIGDTCYACRSAQWEAVATLSGVMNVIASGVAMGQIFKGTLKPDQALAMYCGLRREAVPCVALPEPEALDYLRRREVAAGRFAEGVNLVTTGEGLALGFAKRIGGRVNNMYPNSLRIVNL